MLESINNATAPTRKKWCILRHPDSELIGEIFSGRMKVYNAHDDSQPLPPFEHFIPFSGMTYQPRQPRGDEDQYKSYDAMLDERALRSDLHHFIFIHEPKEVVRKILTATWSRVLRYRLYAYRDENGDPIEISNEEVERFKNVIKRYDFQIVNGEPTDEMHEGDPVAIVSGPMVGSEGKVTKIRERGGQIMLIVEFSMFQDKMRIAVPNISIADVRLKASDAQQLLQDPVIGNFEDELIEMLCHLHGKGGSKEKNRKDQSRLKFLYQYSDIVFEENEADRAKFAALMLICVYLMKDKKAMKWRTKQVEELLQGRTEPASDLDCYLMTALFIVNHDPELRRKAKKWRQSHPECPLAIRRLQSIAKQIRC